MDTLRCLIERVTFQDPESGFTVLKCRAKGHQDLVPVVGDLIGTWVGSVLDVEGSWKVDRKFGRQFVAASWTEELPATAYGIERYLGSGLIKGVGPKCAKKIVGTFGADTLRIIEEEPQKLLSVGGLGQGRIDKIISSWKQQKEIKNIIEFLKESKVSPSFAARIFAKFGNGSIPVMKEDPYRLADEVQGIGFKTSDLIASHLGFSKDSYIRTRSGIRYTLSSLTDEGHVFGRKAQLVTKGAEILGTEPEIVVMTLDHIVKEGSVIQEGDVDLSHKDDSDLFGGDIPIYLPPLYHAENGAARKLRMMAPQHSVPADLRQCEFDIASIEKRTGMVYDESQAGAIRQAAEGRTMVLTGGPGTGKTSTTQGIVEMFRSNGMKVLLAAPTGRAAKRMKHAETKRRPSIDCWDTIRREDTRKTRTAI